MILFFAVSASICLKVFLVSKNMSDYSDNLNNSNILAQNAAECYKAYNGDFSQIKKELGGTISSNQMTIKKDNLKLYIKKINNKSARIYVTKVGEKDEIFSLQVRKGGE